MLRVFGYTTRNAVRQALESIVDLNGILTSYIIWYIEKVLSGVWCAITCCVILKTCGVIDFSCTIPRAWYKLNRFSSIPVVYANLIVHFDALLSTLSPCWQNPMIGRHWFDQSSLMLTLHITNHHGHGSIAVVVVTSVRMTYRSGGADGLVYIWS